MFHSFVFHLGTWLGIPRTVYSPSICHSGKCIEPENFKSEVLSDLER